MMASYCIPQSSCSTHRSSWVNGDHPTSLYATVNTTVCMHWSSTCCERSYPVSITQCDGYYVYKLQKPTSCYERYCGVLGECSKKKNFFNCIPFNDVQEDCFFHIFSSFFFLCDADANDACFGTAGSDVCACNPGYSGNPCSGRLIQILTLRFVTSYCICVMNGIRLSSSSL